MTSPLFDSLLLPCDKLLYLVVSVLVFSLHPFKLWLFVEAMLTASLLLTFEALVREGLYLATNTIVDPSLTLPVLHRFHFVTPEAHVCG